MDRNNLDNGIIKLGYESLSARRAWIEMTGCAPGCSAALRSLSARRAWIEMPVWPIDGRYAVVALRKESVDRNVSDTRYQR